MKTIQELFRSGKLLLTDFPECDLETRLLLCKSASITAQEFYAESDKEITRDQSRVFFRLVNRRLSGVPLSYLTHLKEFWSIPFEIHPGVLIPRPESELIVEKVLDLTDKREAVIVDIGTGCGNLAVSLARVLPEARVVATDISQKALEIAGRNAAQQGVAGITFVRGSKFSPLKRLGLEEKCDFIVSNPPYVSEEDWKSLPPEIRDHEPKKALLAGKTGLEFIEDLVRHAPKYLKPGGRLVLEIGWGQKGRVLSMFGREWTRVRSCKDLNGIPRVVTARK